MQRPSSSPPPLVSLAICAALGLGLATGTAAASSRRHTLEIVNRVPKFEAFYAKATAKPLGEAARWALWKADYGIAAVPPGPEGQKIARQQLDEVWKRYPALAPKAAALEKKGAEAARKAFKRINTLFKTKNAPIRTRVVFYVGQFDGNAYTAPPMAGHASTVMMPVETPEIGAVFARELTHSVNMQLAHVKNGFGAPVGETMFLEGLAMHTAQVVDPGRPDRDDVAMAGDKGWYSRCLAHKGKNPRRHRARSGQGGPEDCPQVHLRQGQHRHAPRALLRRLDRHGSIARSGITYPALARVPEDEMIATIKKGMSMR